MGTRSFVIRLFLLSLLVLFTIGISSSSDAESGALSNGMTWTYDSGTLIISGEGVLSSTSGIPWSDFSDTPVDVVIDSGINRISESCFLDNNQIRIVVFPETLQRIDQHAFRNCWSLEEIILPSSLEVLGEYAFSNCRYVKKLEFGERGPSVIPANCFGYCGANTDSTFDLVIPEGVETIGTFAFGGARCSSLTVSEDLMELGYHSFYGCLDLGGHLSLPNVKKIDEWCFSSSSFDGSPISSIEFSDSLEHIGRGAFWGCKELTSVVIPKNTKAVCMDSFAHCESMVSVVVLSYNVSLETQAFYYCSGLETAELYCKNVGSNVFALCTALREVTLTNTEKLGSGCFANCSGLETVYFSSELREVGAGCFNGTVSLTSIVIPEDNEHFETDGRALLFNYGSELVTYYRGIHRSTYVFPDSVRIVWDNSFTNITELEYLMFGKSMAASTVCYEQFAGCASLSYLDVGPDNVNISSVNGVIYTADRSMLIYAPPAIEKHSLDIHTEVIKSKAFYECTKLRAIRFSAYLSDIGDSAFYGCISLKSLNIQSVTSIAAKAFYGCSSVTKLILTETRDISYGKGCFNTGAETMVIGSNYESGFLDKYLGGTEATYVSLEMDTRSDLEKVKDNTPLVVAVISAFSLFLIGAEILFRRRR